MSEKIRHRASGCGDRVYCDRNGAGVENVSYIETQRTIESRVGEKRHSVEIRLHGYARDLRFNLTEFRVKRSATGGIDGFRSRFLGESNGARQYVRHLLQRAVGYLPRTDSIVGVSNGLVYGANVSPEAIGDLKAGGIIYKNLSLRYGK